MQKKMRGVLTIYEQLMGGTFKAKIFLDGEVLRVHE